MAKPNNWFSDPFVAESPHCSQGDLHPESGHPVLRAPSVSVLLRETTHHNLAPENVHDLVYYSSDTLPAHPLHIHLPQDLGTCYPLCLEHSFLILGSYTADAIGGSQ